MKAVILAGGMGTRLREETDFRPKPMIEIGDKPIIWHIMKIYSAHGVNEFIICLGYKGYMIKEYFINYLFHNSDITIDLLSNKIDVHQPHGESWSVTLVDTGISTMTGGRLKRALPYLGQDDDFCMTYGDGVGNVDISNSIDFHKRHGRAATMTITAPPSRFGMVELTGDCITTFSEKPLMGGGYINAGYFVLSKRIFQYLQEGDMMWEDEPLQSLQKAKQLMAWRHDGFWQCMDTLRDKNLLDALWRSETPPWKIW